MSVKLIRASLPLVFLLHAIFLSIFSSNAFGAKAPWDMLNENEILMLDKILEHWEIWMPEKKEDGGAPLLTFEELYQDLEEREIQFLDRIRKIDPKTAFDFQGEYLGESTKGIEFLRLDDQWITKSGEKAKLKPQYLPKEVHTAYQQMKAAMKKDLGKSLLVDSGYRSPAYQLYTFCFYVPKHHYSLVETGKWIAIPGYSEHGAPKLQAIDFINEEGVDGEDRVEDFEVLPEYHWLLQNAGRFGFELSYPRGKQGITFEPWHWRYINPKH